MNLTNPRRYICRWLLFRLSQEHGDGFTFAQARALYIRERRVPAGHERLGLYGDGYWATCNCAVALGAAVQLGWIRKESRGVYKFLVDSIFKRR